MIFFQKKLCFVNKKLTIKNEENSGIDSLFRSNFKKYIYRRIEQHKYYDSLFNSKKKNRVFTIKNIGLCS